MINSAPLQARTNDLIVEQVDDETLVYDQRTDAAHCLGSAAAAVWRACDGETSDEELVAMVAALGEDDPELVVERALADLADRDLLLPTYGVSRRAALSRMATMGAAALAVPLVLSIKAPTAEAGFSPMPNGSACTLNTGCTSGFCCTSGANSGKCGVATGSAAPGNICPSNGKNSACCSGNCDKDTKLCVA